MKSVGRFARSVEMMTQRPTIGSFLSSGNYGILSEESRKPHILRRQGSISKHFNLRAGRAICIVYAYDIESPRARGRKPPQILVRHCGHFPPFVPVHGRFWRLHVARGPRLNFNEAKNVCIPTNQVNLPSATRRTKVARHDGITQLSQVRISVFLTAPANALMARHRVRRKGALCNPIQSADDRSREDGWKHGWMKLQCKGEQGSEM